MKPVVMLLFVPAIALAAPSRAADGPIAPERLAAFLPAIPPGWVAEQANREVARVGAGSQSMASRSYARRWTAGEPSVDVAIRDMGPAESSRSALRAEIEDACSRLAEACRPVKGERWTGHAGTLPESKAAEIAVIVGDRYAVQLWGSNVTAEDLEMWLALLHLDRLAALAGLP